MHDFIGYVLHLAQRGMILAVPLILLCAGGIAGFYIVFRRRWKGEKQFPWSRRKVLAVLLLAGYGAVVLYATLLRGEPHASYASLHLFRAWREAWNQCSVQGWMNVLLNVGLFIPLGLLLPLLSRTFEKWYWMLAASFGGSLVIELLQFITGRGYFDVDDLFCNTLGGLLGYCMILSLLCLMRKGGRRSALWYLLLPLIFCGTLAGLYGYYQAKEYGNLPEAPFFRADTRSVTWETDLIFDEDPITAPVYQMEPFTKETCDDFGYQFAQQAGFALDADDIAYYDNCTIFMNHSTGDFLNVNYFDRSYEYGIGQHPKIEAQTESGLEIELREILAGYGIQVPESADFVRKEDGGYAFAIHMEQVGDRLLDGTLSLAVNNEAELIRIQNEMKDCAPYREADIMPAAEAYLRLQRGQFSDGDYFEAMEPERVEVRSCQLVWQMDSKGFYRPVYQFACSLDGEDLTNFFVPAMK